MKHLKAEKKNQKEKENLLTNQTCSIGKKEKGLMSDPTAQRKLFLENFTSLVSQEYRERPRSRRRTANRS